MRAGAQVGFRLLNAIGALDGRADLVSDVCADVMVALVSELRTGTRRLVQRFGR